MEVNQTKHFEVQADKGLIWAMMNDPWKVGQCLVGAKVLEEIKTDHYKGEITLKIGPVKTQFEGIAEYTKRDESQYQIHLKGQGSDKQGKGSATLNMEIQLTDTAEGAIQVESRVHLSITGRIAQFGARMINVVNDKMFTQFTTNFQKLIEIEKQKSESDSPESDSNDEPATNFQNDDTLNMNKVVMSLASEKVSQGIGSIKERLGRLKK